MRAASDSPSRPVRWPALATALATLGGAVGFVLAEGWIVALVAGLGPLAAFVVVTAVSSAGSVLIAYAFDCDAEMGTGPFIARVRRWIAEKRIRVEARMGRFAEASAVFAFVALSVTVGPFLTAIAVKLRGESPRGDYALCVLASAIFSAVWVFVYWGGVAAIRAAFSGG